MKNINIDFPLVSIAIITYNSSKYVLETLESAKAQTYKNIELIVTDDGSTDNSDVICQKWLVENKDRFVRTKLITSPENTGITPNCNRGLSVVQGKWVKFIAGDDILLENCINDFVNFCLKNDNCKILFGKLYYLKNGKLKEEEIKPFYSLSQKDQYVQILKGSGIPAQTCFFNVDTLRVLGGFDERYKFIEDAPLWIKASEKGIHFFFINKFVTKYRLHDNNISGISRGAKFINETFYYDSKRITLNEVIPRLRNCNKYIVILNKYNNLLINQVIIFLGNRNNIFSKFLELFIIKRTVVKALALFRKLVSNIRTIRK